MNPPDVAIRVSHLADAADQLGFGDTVGGSLPAWLGRPGTMAIGPAFTVQQRAVPYAEGDQAPQTRHGEVAASLVPAGSLIVIDVQGETAGATWGEAQTLRARNRGAVGVLINGCTRDLEGLRERGFPVLCRGASPLRSKGRMETVAIECDLHVMGVHIRHGDIVAIDADGFVRLHAEHVEAVLARAREIAHLERERDLKLDTAS